MKVRHVDLYADEWLVGTVELDNAERGLYITACCLIYSTGGEITRDRLRAACRDHGHAFNRQLNALVAKGKLTINGEQITNKRSINELQKVEERTVKAQQNGSKGGRPRKEINEITKPDGLNSEKLTINHQPSTINQDTLSSDKDNFTEFYRVYPRHEARRAAERAYRAACKRAPPERINAGAERYAEQRAGQDKQFTKLPATWLNADCWADGEEDGRGQHREPTDEEREAARVEARERLGIFVAVDNGEVGVAH